MAGAFEPELAQVTSNDLEASIRSLLPSVSGFGSRLGAQNVIVPIVDLTPTAEGSILPTDLQRALAFGSQTHFDITNTTATLTSTPGFYRVTGTATTSNTPTLNPNAELQMTDGVTTKTIWAIRMTGTSTDQYVTTSIDYVFFVANGITLQGSATAETNLQGSIRQIADSNGNLINPDGFTSL